MITLCEIEHKKILPCSKMNSTFYFSFHVLSFCLFQIVMFFFYLKSPTLLVCSYFCNTSKPSSRGINPANEISSMNSTAILRELANETSVRRRTSEWNGAHMQQSDFAFQSKAQVHSCSVPPSVHHLPANHTSTSIHFGTK